MQRVLIVLLLITCFIVAVAKSRAEGETAQIYGIGGVKCKELSETQLIAAYVWAQGYISGRNWQTALHHEKPFQTTRDNFNYKDQYAFMLTYCKINPELNPSDAADAIIERLKAMEALGGS